MVTGRSVKTGGREICRYCQFFLVWGWELRSFGWAQADLRDAGGRNRDGFVKSIDFDDHVKVGIAAVAGCAKQALLVLKEAAEGGRK